MCVCVCVCPMTDFIRVYGGKTLLGKTFPISPCGCFSLPSLVKAQVKYRIKVCLTERNDNSNYNTTTTLIKPSIKTINIFLVNAFFFIEQCVTFSIKFQFAIDTYTHNSVLSMSCVRSLKQSYSQIKLIFNFKVNLRKF